MNKHEVNIPQWKIKRLIKLGEEFKTPFNFPPFNGDINEGYYDIDKLKKTKKFQDFLSIIHSLNISYEYAFHPESKKKIFMTIKMKD
jgi:adenine C2-methylase RlmN of 23S rRNA A2503 and tRNA A37